MIRGPLMSDPQLAAPERVRALLPEYIKAPWRAELG